MANLNLSRRSFGLGLIAHGITACDKVENYAIPTDFAEKNVPIKGQVLDIAGFNLHGYIEGNGSQDIVCILVALVNLRDWVFAACSLSKRDNRFIYIDIIGSGYSDRANSDWDVETKAE